MHQRFTSLALALVVSLACGLEFASADIITYTNRADWEKANFVITGGEDFNGFGSDVFFQGTTVNIADNMVLGTQVSTSSTNNVIDAASFYNANTEVDGTTHVNFFNGLVGQDSTPFIQFGDAVSAFGADFSDLNDDSFNTFTEIELYDSNGFVETITPPLSNGTGVNTFFGFIALDFQLITELRFTRVQNDIWGMDNIEISTIPVPEPTGFCLFAIAVVGLARRRNR